MKKKLLLPSKILTLTDFPVHNGHILKIYFKMCQEGAWKLVPPCPVMKISRLPFLEGKGKRIARYNSALKSFMKSHPAVEYVLLDGSHRTTAATLANKKTITVLFENERDIKEAKALLKTGELLGLTVDDLMLDVIQDIQKHFLRNPVFETVEEKAKRMIKERVVPSYMISVFTKS